MNKNEVRVDYVNTKTKKDAEIRWWKVPSKEMHSSVFAAFKKVEQNQNYRRQLNNHFIRLYNGQPPLALAKTNQVGISKSDATVSSRMTINVITSCIDTATSKIGTIKTRPFFLTNKGNWGQQKRAEELTDFFDGLFAEIEFYEKTMKQFQDGALTMAGFLKFFVDQDSKKIQCERVLCNEIAVDDVDAIYNSPRTLYHIKMYDRQVMIEKFKKFETEIRAASSVKDVTNSQTESDMIYVIESWHLRSSENSKDGAHAISIEGATLFSEGWTKNYFPFTKYVWGDKYVGFWGFPIAEELIPIQLDINKTCRSIQTAHHLFGIPRIFIEDSTKVNTGHLNNEIASVVKFKGAPPIFSTPQAINPELYMHLDTQINRAYEIVGITQMESQGVKPAGLNSQPSLRTYQDIGSERFKANVRRFEDCQMSAVDILIDLLEEIDNGSYEVSCPSKKAMKKIKWSKVKIDRNDFILQKYPTNFLPASPEGKMEKAIEMIEAGLIPQEHARSLLDFPDLKFVKSLSESNRELILKIIDGILNEGEYESPEPFYDLQLAMKLSQESYLSAKIDGYPEERLEMLQTYITNVAELLKLKAQQEQANAMAVEQMAQMQVQAQMTPQAPQSTSLAQPLPQEGV